MNTVTFGPFGFTVVLFLAGIVLLVWHRRRSQVATEPSCRRCRYPVVGLERPVCPECGADLGSVGILPPGSRRPSLLLALVIWALLMPLPAVLGTLAMRAAFVRTVTTRFMSARLTAPMSGAFDAAVITVPADAMGPNDGVADPDARIELLRSGSPTAQLDVRKGNRGYAYRTRDGRTRSVDDPLDRRGLLAWMADAGLDTASDGVVGNADAILGQVEVGMGQSSAPLVFRGSSSVSSAMGAALVNAGVVRATGQAFLLLWVVGVVVLVTRHRRRRRLDRARAAGGGERAMGYPAAPAAD